MKQLIHILHITYTHITYIVRNIPILFQGNSSYMKILILRESLCRQEISLRE